MVQNCQKFAFQSSEIKVRKPIDQVKAAYIGCIRSFSFLVSPIADVRSLDAQVH